MDKNTLAHTTWECKYHLVFASLFRGQIIYGDIKADVAQYNEVPGGCNSNVEEVQLKKKVYI